MIIRLLKAISQRCAKKHEDAQRILVVDNLDIDLTPTLSKGEGGASLVPEHAAVIRFE
jgi:hypothetical protein